MANGNDIVAVARNWCGVKYSHQGRTRQTGLDCGGLVLVVANSLGLSELEELGYSSFPNNGRFENLLNEHADNLNIESVYPHTFTGAEFEAGDILGFDYQNAEGVRHTAFVSKFDGANYWVIDAIPDYGVCEHPLRHPFSKARILGFRVKGLCPLG
jgi:cell wall-associated NlpC family hydrolase